MAGSPLTFATDFAKLKSFVKSEQSDDLKLRRLVRFWPELYSKLPETSHLSFIEEFSNWLESLVDRHSLIDMSPEFLLQLSKICRELISAACLSPATLRTVLTRLAVVQFYLGDYDSGWLTVCEIADRSDLVLPSDLQFDGLAPYEILTHLHALAPEPAKREISPILDDWTVRRSSLGTDKIWSLFVENSRETGASIGRLRLLEGSVELARKTSRADDISFQNQIRTPDDPFVGAGYDALEAVRQYHTQHRLTKSNASHFHAHYKIPDQNAIFTGDSIGLAIGMIAHTQLMTERGHKLPCQVDNS